MPKEIAHFAMARKVGETLPPSSVFHEAVRRYPSLFTLGAVTPDINFFYLAGPDKNRIRALSDPFHNPSKQALSPVLAFLDREAAGRIPPLPALALSAGTICHILADTVFHPLVYYYAGMDGIHFGATARHRQFETAMDLYFWYRDRECPLRVDRLVRSLEIGRGELIALLNSLFRPGPMGCRGLRTALRWYMGIQYLFCAPWMKRILKAMKRAGRPLPPKAAGLAYPFAYPVDLPFFRDRIRFTDPCTREERETAMADLAWEAVTSTLKILDMSGRQLSRGKPCADILNRSDLPRICPDLPREEFYLWREKDDIIPKLYRGYPPPF